MTTRWMAGVVAAVAMAWAGSAAAGGGGAHGGSGSAGTMGSSTSPSGQAGTQASNQLQGKVTKVSNADSSVFVLDPSSQHVVVLKIDPTISKVFMNGQAIGMSGLSQGQQVRASYNLCGNDMVAQRVDVFSGSGSMGGSSTGSGSNSNTGTGGSGLESDDF